MAADAARLHAATLNETTRLPFNHTPAASIGGLSDWQGHATEQAECAFQIIKDVPEPDMTFIHDDLTASNTLNSEQGLQWYIDFELAKKGCRYRDIAHIIRATGIAPRDILSTYFGRHPTRDERNHLSFELAHLGLERQYDLVRGRLPSTPAVIAQIDWTLHAAQAVRS
jgi:hypothetical protein